VCVCVVGGSAIELTLKMKTSVPDRGKEPHVSKEKNFFTRLHLAWRGLNHPRLPNGEIKESLEL
jgi:hypothetical protein